MSIKTLKGFQETAVASALDVFSAAKEQLNAAGANVAGRAMAVNHNGYLLIEAPTGSGKTLMAGNIAERFSQEENVVWFWFAPFKGVVGQSAGFLRSQLHGLRLRELSTDRSIESSKAGDVFVTTWQSVATRVTDTRNIRREAETNPSIDVLIDGLRARGLRIGVVVDEAHHSFGSQTQASAFFREVLNPEYTVLVTATPDDKDLKEFEKSMGIAELHRIQISREDVVETGLIKSGVKCIAYFADAADGAMVDLAGTALRDGVRSHREIKERLQGQGVDLVPLLLVQADSQKSVPLLKQRLITLGFTEDQIATHTASEPDKSLLALANDEAVEVLVFVMAVALGFDAPRAFNLVSMRASRNPDFGVQLVGRILRVHQRLHVRARDKKLPLALNLGYVFLADPDTQTGLDQAGQMISGIKTAYASVSRLISATPVGVARVTEEGQIELFPSEDGAAVPASSTIIDLSEGAEEKPFSVGGLFADLDLGSNVGSEGGGSGRGSQVVSGGYRYKLRADVPKRFMTQIVSPNSQATEEECAHRFIIPTNDRLEALTQRVSLEKRTLEIFTSELQHEFSFEADLSPGRVALLAQKALLQNKTFDPRELKRALFNSLKADLRVRGFEGAESDTEVGHLLNMLIATNPQALFDAQKAALAANAIVRAAEDLPSELVSDAPLPTSTRNVYGHMPGGLTSWESKFVKVLDGDGSGTVLWWHRNLPHKPSSVNVLMTNGKGFFPDLVIGLKGRTTLDHVLLADPKRQFEVSAEIPKIDAEHREYGRVMILALTGQEEWRIAALDANGKANANKRFTLQAGIGF